MTGASVKNLGSMITFVNTGKVQNAAGQKQMNFSDVMTKAEDGQGSRSIGSENSKLKKNDDFTSKTDLNKKVENTDSSKIRNEASASKEESPLQSKDEGTMKNLEEAGETVAKEIADAFDETVEKVEEAMENLMLSYLSLLDSSNMGQMVLELSGETDPIALVTDENLMGMVENLTTVVDATIADLAEDMDVEVPDVEEFLKSIEGLGMNAEETEMSVNADSDNISIEEAVPVELPADLSEDEPGTEEDENISGTKNEVDFSQNSVAESSKDYGDKSVINTVGEKNDNESNQSHNQGILFKNPILENLVNNTQNATPTEEVPFISEETRNIMDQILDHMKVSIKPDVDEISLQLHPASLGNVKVNLVSKAGEITAEFKVQNEQVKIAVEAQLNDLRETFRAQGTKVTAIEVSVEMQSFDSNLWEGKGHNSGEEPENRNHRPRRISLDELEALFADGDLSEEDRLAGEMMKATGSTVDYMA